MRERLIRENGGYRGEGVGFAIFVILLSEFSGLTVQALSLSQRTIEPRSKCNRGRSGELER